MGIEYWFNDEKYTCDSFDELIQLDNYNDIIKIHCDHNELTTLPKLPNNLEKLCCSYNQLTMLPKLPNSLEELRCYYNQLTLLPELPNSLEKLSCFYNQLTILPELPTNLEELGCGSNRLTFLPKLPNSLNDFYYDNNPVYYYIHDKFGGNMELYYKENKIFANKIGEWFLECKYNPEYKYCRDRVDKEYDKLF